MRDSPTVEIAVDIVARHVIARMTDMYEQGEQWENYPEVGQFDWERVENRVGQLTQYPDENDYKAAYAFLVARADDKVWVP